MVCNNRNSNTRLFDMRNERFNQMRPDVAWKKIFISLFYSILKACLSIIRFPVQILARTIAKPLFIGIYIEARDEIRHKNNHVTWNLN